VTASHPLLQRLSARLRQGGDQPIANLIIDDVWLAVVEGTLSSGERLPTARQVAVGLGVSPRTVERAYRELEARGVVASRPGEGSFISLAPPPAEERERHRRFGELCRQAFEDARELGFAVDDLIDALVEFRTIERTLEDKEMSP
jgi:GntR family transcriptional regulator